MMRRVFFMLLIGLLSAACKPSGPPESAVKNNPETTEGKVAASLPSVPDSLMLMLWDRCDYIDMLFYHLSFSASQDRQDDIRASLQHISRETPVIDPACAPIGRIFYQVDGRNAAEADIFFSPQCQYFVFFRNGEKAYANKMTPQGIQFYERILSTVNQ